MSYRLTKIYTRTGDDGSTSLVDKQRIPKNDPRIQTIGSIDELNSMIGLVLAYEIKTMSVKTCLIQVQHDLFEVGGELSLPEYQGMTAEKIKFLENAIDAWNATLPPLKEFILPGGNLPAATCHVARAICRRAERELVALHQQEVVSDYLLQYLNRLSDVLFVAARMLAKESWAEEVFWEHDSNK